MEQYIDQIKDCTFGFTFREFPSTFAKELIRHHDDRSLAPSASSTLQALVGLIDEAKTTMNWQKIFIRLSSRSPKDAALNSPRFSEIYHRVFARLTKEEEGIAGATLSNRQLQALYYASTWALSVESGSEAVQLLVDSKRIQGDLEEYSTGKISVPFQICVREFRTFHPEFEFRGFIYRNKFTALTQYNELCYFPFLQQKKQRVLDQINQDFAEIMPKIPQVCVFPINSKTTLSTLSLRPHRRSTWRPRAISMKT